MKKTKKLAGLEKRKAISGYIFIAPFVIGFLVFMVKPFIDSLLMSFQNVQLSGNGYTRTFNGLENYNYAFRVDAQYNRLLTEELVRMIEMKNENTIIAKV